MSNKELYKRSFDKLQPSEKLQKEINEMMNDTSKSSRRMKPRRAVVLVAAVAAMLSLTAAAYASGGFRMIRVRINGEVPENGAVMYDVDGDDYIVEVEAQDGDEVDVVYSVETVDPDELPIPAIEAKYENRDGADLLVFTNTGTGEIYELDITDELADGSYAGDLTVFDCDCRAELTMDGENVSLDFEVNGIHSVDFGVTE